MKEFRLLLIGGGHAHVAVLADWIRYGAPERAALITPAPTLRYSGMVPGWIAGEHASDEGLVDLAGLAARAGIELILDKCTAIDGDARTIATTANGSLRFEFASLDTGGIGRGKAILGEDPRLLEVRPIQNFVEQLEAWRMSAAGSQQHVAVAGGGAGGVELAFGLRNAAGMEVKPNVTLVTGGQGLLPDFAAGVRRKVAAELMRQGIVMVVADASIEAGKLMAGLDPIEPVDLIVAALGSAAPIGDGALGIDCDDGGFIAVDRFQRSISHPHIFATGDVASRQDRKVSHSGVHAVHAGPILSANLRAVLEGRMPSQSYRPRPASLYLLSTGNGEAIGSYGPVAVQGRWVARFKRWIDKRWIGSYARLAGTNSDTP